MKELKNLTLLNLGGTLKEKTIEVFSQFNISVVEKDEIGEHELDYILIKDESQLQEVIINFNVLEKGIFLLSLGKVSDSKEFLMGNGRLVIDEDLIAEAHYQIVLENFFTNFTSVHLDESFPNTFDVYHQFDITEHASVGQLTDELASIVLERRFNPVTVRTFVDHLVYYFTYLRQAGLAHAPFEFECGMNEDILAIEVNVTMRNFVSEYLLDSFGSINSRDPLQFLLSIVQKSCDFLNINFVEKNSKLIITGLWGKESHFSTGNIAFQNIFSTEQILSRLDKKVSEYSEVEFPQHNSADQALPGSIVEMIVSPDKDSYLAKDDKKASDLVAFVIGRFEEENPNISIQSASSEKLKEILKSYPDQDIIEVLTENDLDHVVGIAQKNHITKAYEEEIERVRGSFEGDEELSQKLSETFEKESIQKIKGKLDAETIQRILGSKEPKEEIIHVEGTKDASEFVQTIKGIAEKKDDFVARFSSTFEERSTMFDFDKNNQGSKRDALRDILKSSSSSYYKKFNVDIKAQEYLTRKLPSHFDQKIESFSKKLGKDIENFNLSDLELFRQVELPKILNDVINDDIEIEKFEKELESGIDINLSNPSEKRMLNKDLESKFKQILEKNLKKIENFQETDLHKVDDDLLKKDEVQKIIQSSLSELLKENFKLKSNSKEELKEKEEKLVQDLSLLFPNKKEEFLTAVSEATGVVKKEELQKVLDNLFIEQKKIEAQEDLLKKGESHLEAEKAKVRSLAESELVKKLKKSQEENKRLLNELQALKVAKESQVETAKTAILIEDEAQKTAQSTIKEEVPIETLQNSAFIQEHKIEKEKLLNDLKEGKSLTETQGTLIQDLLEKEKLILQKEKEADLVLRKNQIENNLKETLFKRELEKANKLANSKDLVLQKAKESMKVLVTKKELEIQGLNKKLQDLLKKMADDKSTIMEKEIFSLRKDNENLGRMTEVYKNKLSAMAKSMMKNNKKDDSQNLEAKNRELSRLKIQLENNLNSETRKNKIAQDKLEATRVSERELRADVNRLNQVVKELNDQNKKLKEANLKEPAVSSKSNDAELAQVQQLNVAMSVKIKELEDKVKELAMKASSHEMQANGSQQNSSAKEKQLETQAKKLNSELSKAKVQIAEEKKNFVKLKAENTALKNQISKLKKDISKIEGAKNTKKAA